jgi:hypothetical protein
MELTQAQFDAAAACGCNFVPADEAQVARLSMQRRIFTRNGKPFVATRDAGGFHETHTTLALLIDSHAGSEVSSRGDTLHQVAAADAASAKEMESERGTGGAQEVPSRQPATGPRTSARGVRRRQ